MEVKELVPFRQAQSNEYHTSWPNREILTDSGILPFTL
jgi:hypothetical protein